MPIRPAHNARGFTLLEVLIALAVLAIGMIAVIGTAGTSTRTAAELKEETFAHWVAMNELASLRLSANWPSLGTLKGHADMAGEQWNWRAKIKDTSDPDLLRVDIDVSSAAAPDEVLSSLTGFIGQSHQLPPPGSSGPQSGPSAGSTPVIP
ncbi:MAG: type II secretion system minor pseudopilin GspI [Gammaproteobacteria bacterium]|nr:type II secretion system minor pseudopilin GspI [Gammaproteobacteria bacterium]